MRNATSGIGTKTCKRGHDYDASKKFCPVCHKERNRTWSQANKEKMNASRRADYAENKERYAANSKRWNDKNKERLREYSKSWYLENREKKLAQTKEYNKEHKEAQRKRQLAWKKANPERAAKAIRKWAQENRESRNESSRRQYAANPEKHKAFSKAWAIAHPEESREIRRRIAHRRRARKQERSIEKFTTAEWLAIVSFYDYKCAYCEQAEYEVTEHVVALVDGGVHALSNLVPACNECNIRKEVDRRKGIRDWRPKIEHPLLEIQIV